MKRTEYCWGFDIGGTKCALVIGDETGRLLRRWQVDTATFGRNWRVLLDTLLTCPDETVPRPNAIGVSCGGPLDTRKGLILGPPNLPGWDRVPIRDYLEERVGVPVFLQNDANACALAEWKYGAGKGCRNMVFLTFGTGLGAGLILDGRLYSGTNDMAGEVGHIRMAETGPVGYGKAGAWEGFCSGGGLKQLSRQMTGREQTAKELVEAADKGDSEAAAVLEKSARMLGKGLAVLVDILNPERIIIGSIYTRAERWYKEYAWDMLLQEALGQGTSCCRILPSKLGEYLGDAAALCVAWNGLEEQNVPEYRYQKALEVLIGSFRAGGKLLLCGNGGSSADCAHILGELIKGFLNRRPLTEDMVAAIGTEWAAKLQGGLPVIDLGANGALISAVSNDIDAASVYAQQVIAYGCRGDVIIGISTSGNAENVCRALQTARAKGMTTIAMTGKGGGRLAVWADILLAVEETETYRVQEKHLPLYHRLCMDIERAIFGIDGNSTA